MPVLDREERELERIRVLEKCQRDSWYLAGKLGYHWNPNAGGGEFPGKGLTEQFHKPIFRWFDRHALAPFVGQWFPRWHHKTTAMIVFIVQEILKDPYTYMLYFHAINELAEGVVNEAGTHFMQNPFLRSLDPIGHDENEEKYTVKVMPHKAAKRWLKASAFTLNRPRWGYSRFATLTGKGAGSEVTGMHGKRAFIDDPIGRQDVEDSTIAKKTDWYENTLLPVIDDMWVRASGTPWSDWGMYANWWRDPHWKTLVLPASHSQLYVDGELDLTRAVDWSQDKIHYEPEYLESGRYDLRFPVYGTPETKTAMTKKLRILESQMKSNFAYQIMVDTSPKGEKPWDKTTCENFIGLKPRGDLPGAAGPGVYVVLSDPAPVHVGAQDGTKQKTRGDGTKDFWSQCVLKLRIRNELLEAILITGKRSRSWTTDAGMDVACGLMSGDLRGLRWRTNKCIHEAIGSNIATYHERMKAAAQRNGIRWLGEDERGRPINFKDSYVAGAKNLRFADLASMAKLGQFYIYEHCPEEYLYGPPNSVHEGVLGQGREWKPLEGGKNSLTYDDDADIVARLNDSALQQWIPKVRYDAVAPEDLEESFWGDEEQYTPRSRYGVM